MDTNRNNNDHKEKNNRISSSDVQLQPRKKKKKKFVKSRIFTNPNICGGEPFIKGTRIPVHIILTHLLSGDDDETILENFPKLKKEDIEACRVYAEKRARKRYSN